MPPINTDTVRRLPAPWTLHGHAFTFLVRMPEDDLRDRCFVAPGLAERRVGRISVFMYVNYSDSNAGAYHELMFIPARYEFNGRRRWTISKIYVSGMDTLVNGRENWGIPKELAKFDSSIDGRGVELVRAGAGNAPFAEMEFAPYGPSFPMTTSLVPPFLRTLAQYHGGKLYTVAPDMRFTARLARINRMKFDERYFPDISRGRILLGGYCGNFTFMFPPAHIE